MVMNFPTHFAPRLRKARLRFCGNLCLVPPRPPTPRLFRGVTALAQRAPGSPRGPLPSAPRSLEEPPWTVSGLHVHLIMAFVIPSPRLDASAPERSPPWALEIG